MSYLRPRLAHTVGKRSVWRARMAIHSSRNNASISKAREEESTPRDKCLRAGIEKLCLQRLPPTPQSHPAHSPSCCPQCVSRHRVRSTRPGIHSQPGCIECHGFHDTLGRRLLPDSAGDRINEKRSTSLSLFQGRMRTGSLWAKAQPGPLQDFPARPPSRTHHEGAPAK